MGAEPNAQEKLKAGSGAIAQRADSYDPGSVTLPDRPEMPIKSDEMAKKNI